MDQGYPRQYDFPAEPEKRKRGRPVGSKNKKPSYDQPYGPPYGAPYGPSYDPYMPPPRMEPRPMPPPRMEPYRDIPVAESVTEVMAEPISHNTISNSDYDKLLVTIATDNHDMWDPSNGSWQWYVFLAAGIGIMSAFLGYESVQLYKWWIEAPGGEEPDGPDEPEYIPPPLDEEDLLNSTAPGGFSFMLPVFVLAILAGCVWFFFLVKRAAVGTTKFVYNDLIAIPPFWILFSLAVYGFMAYVALRYSNSRRSMAGPLSTTERAIISVSTMFMVFALLVVLVGLYRKMERVADTGEVNYEKPYGIETVIMGLTLAIAVLVGHIIWTHEGVIEWIEKDTPIGTQYRAYIVPTMVATTLFGMLMFKKVWQTRLVVPIVCISVSLSFIFYLQAQLHTDFGKYSAIAGKGQGDIKNSCMECDVYHQFTNGAKGNLIQKYARTICDTKTGTLKRKQAAKSKAFRLFDGVVAADESCTKTCAQAKGILQGLTCKCTPSEQKNGVLCDSVATLEFYKSYHEYNKDQGFGDSGNISTFEIVSVAGTGALLLVVLTIANQVGTFQPTVAPLSPF